MVNVGFVGAGGVNFGGAEGPWDHATRLERLGCTFVGIADRDTARARSVLSTRQRVSNKFAQQWAHCRVFSSADEMLSQLRGGLDAVYVGLPPSAHGPTEILFARAGVHLFVEKPLGVRSEEVLRVSEALAQSRVVVGVGYMMRYLRAVAAMKEELRSSGRPVVAVIARYGAAYEQISKAFWWDKERSGGPIVEQATHFCDLARYLASSDAVLSSVRAFAVSARDGVGALSKLPVDSATGRPVEDGVPDNRRIERATVAIWRFESGALGSLAHGALQHGGRYDTEVEVWCDGLSLKLIDSCTLLIRRGAAETCEQRSFKGDDPYLSEDAAFVDAVRSGDASRLLSSYTDAVKTFELTWAIRSACEAAAADAKTCRPKL